MFNQASGIRGTMKSIDTSIGTISVGDAVIVEAQNGNRIEFNVIEISSRFVKVNRQFLRFDVDRGLDCFDCPGAFKIVEVVKGN